MSDIPLGRPCWHELMTTNPDDAPGFYGPITGWSSTPFEGSDPPYHVWMNGETPIGGYMRLPDEVAATGAPSHWMMYVSTPDISATVAKTKELGGTVLNQMSMPSIGDLAVIQDPQGAVFSAFQPEGDTPGHDGLPAVGEFSWHELMTSDWEAAWSFYSELFGWEKTDQMHMGEMGIYQMWGRGAHPLGGFMNRPPDMPMSVWLFYVRVPDADQAVEQIKASGGQVLIGPMEVPDGDRVAQCADPSGAAFAVHSTAAT